jgi:hypothetical protein
MPGRRGVEFGSLSHLPSIVVARGRGDLLATPGVSDFAAFIAEIEPEILSGVGFLLAITKSAIERMIGFQFALMDTLGCARLWDRMVDKLFPGFNLLRIFFTLGRRLELTFRDSRGRDCLAHHNAGFCRRAGRARTLTRRAEHLRRLRVSLGGLGSGGTHFRGKGICVEHVAASRTLEGRRVVGQHPLVNPIAGMATSALNFDHRPTSQAATKNITPGKTAQLPVKTAQLPVKTAQLPVKIAHLPGRCGDSSSALSREGAIQCE